MVDVNQVQAEVIGKPEQQVMGGSTLESLLADKNGLLVKQTMRGCLQECLGCEAKSEYKISAMEWDMIQDEYKVVEGGMEKEDIMYALENSSFLCRCCWRDGRPFDLQVSAGGEQGGEQLVSFKKPCGFPLYFDIPLGENGKITCPCCCLLPKVDTMLPGGQPLGSESKYICDMYLCVPKLKYSENGEAVYILRPETCCGGCCISISCNGKGLIYLPFYFHEPNTMQVIGGEYGGKETPQIRKLWAGLKKECCSTADTFAVMFPTGIDWKRKAGLIGLTFLLDFTMFERQQDKN